MRKKFLTHFKSAFVVASLCCTAPIISSVNSADNTISPPEEGKNFSLSIPADPKEVLLELIYISPGSFSMGSPSLEIGRDEDETLHRVNISNGYWIGRFEITQEQYEPLMKENLAKWKGANIPAQSITYDKALEFCKKLTKAAQDKGLPQNYRFTLPTEAQWEYAARAGSISALGNGKTFTGKESCPNLNEIAWFSENSENKVHPIGLKQPNNWGIYDMQGNVAEWCLDFYAPYPSDSVTDPMGPDKGNGRVLRGGSYAGWYGDAASCRTACRISAQSSYVSYGTGFRVILTNEK